MSDSLGKWDRWGAVLPRLLSYIAAAGIFMLMALVFVSVFFRYVLNYPIIATEDMMAMLLGFTIFTAVPGVTLSRGHICVELLTAPFRRFPAANRFRLILIDIGVVAMTLYMAKRLFDQAERFKSRETGTPLMDWPLYPFAYAFAALLVLGAVLFALRAIKDRGQVASKGETSL